MSTRNEPITAEKKVAQLPLTSMNYSGDVEGSIANLQLELAYQNRLDHPIEPIFTFPLPAEASVLGVTVKVGNRTIQSELKKAVEARADYDQAVSAGHQASLLEQQRDNIFTMSVGGIEPGENIQVSLNYMHPVDWQGGGGRFVVPLVVAPHFIHGRPLERSQGLGFSPDTDAVPDASRITPHVAGDPDEVTYHAGISINLRPGFDAHVACPSHDAIFPECDVPRGGAVKLELADLRPDRDLTFTYQTKERLARLKADRTVWRSAEGGNEEFTLLQLVPGCESQPKARQVVLCLDCSGSMEGLPLAGLKTVAQRLLEQLKESAESVEIAVVKFNDRPKTLLPLEQLTSQTDVERIIKELRAEGGTRASLALKQSLSLFSKERPDGVERSVIFVTDGDTSDVDIDRGDNLKGARIHCVGLSTAVDHAVLKDIARLSGGSTYWIYPGEDYDTAVREILGRTTGPVVRDLRINGLVPESDIVGLGDVYAGQPVAFAARSPTPSSRLVVHGLDSMGQPVQFYAPALGEESTVSFAHIAWAKMKLRQNLEPDEMTEISLKYGVLARTTAFVAVLLRERPGAKPERIEIPVSLPHGWEMEEGWTRGVLLGAADHGMFAARATASLDADMMCCSLDSIDCGDVDERDLLAEMPAPRKSGRGILGRLRDRIKGPDLDSLAADEPELLHSAKELLSALQTGQIDQRASQQLWTGIVDRLNQEREKGFASWTDDQRAELYLALGTLRGYGFKVEIPAEVRARPGDARVLPLWRQAERTVGIQRSA